MSSPTRLPPAGRSGRRADPVRQGVRRTRERPRRPARPRRRRGGAAAGGRPTRRTSARSSSATSPGQPDASNIARVIALRSGIPQDRIAHTVNRNCASGMEAIFSAWQILAEGRAELDRRRRHRVDVERAAAVEPQGPRLLPRLAEGGLLAAARARLRAGAAGSLQAGGRRSNWA